MAYEVDYMPVGEGEKSGDAIVLRFGNLTGPREQQTVIVIDGGYQESGELLVNHINEHYGTNEVNYVILTHPDIDHASGLCVVLEKMKVGALIMHKPWEHAEDIKSLFQNGKITASGLQDKIEKSLQHASDLESMAQKKGIPIYEPFEGTYLDNVFHVLGPSKDYYQSLLPHFKDMPAPKISLGAFAPIFRKAEEVANWIQDHIGIDLLDDDNDTTSASNNTSAIIVFVIDGHKLLFTGDAGKTALLNAIAYADSKGFSLTDLNFLDVPHHGSKRNLSSKILKKIKATTAFISAPTDSPKHPAKRVTNALRKHGHSVYVTRGKSILHHNQGNARGWGDIESEPFHDRFEE